MREGSVFTESLGISTLSTSAHRVAKCAWIFFGGSGSFSLLLSLLQPMTRSGLNSAVQIANFDATLCFSMMDTTSFRVSSKTGLIAALIGMGRGSGFCWACTAFAQRAAATKLPIAAIFRSDLIFFFSWCGCVSRFSMLLVFLVGTDMPSYLDLWAIEIRDSPW